MSAGVVLDTSFLITLAGPDRSHHAAARRYWKHFSESGIPIYLPTIVVSEFCCKQEIPPEILRSCVLLPFNWDDAIKASSLDLSSLRQEGQSRVALKDDLKIIAQAIVKDAAYLITDDNDTFYRYATRLTTIGQSTFKAIKLEDGFDRSFFRPNGQRDFEDSLNEGETDLGE